jgi:RimJ/RimL family protein N-acetyltransferase
MKGSGTMIEGKRIYFRSIETTDIPQIVHWRNQKDIHDYFYEYEPLSILKQEKWLAYSLNTEDKNFIICDSEYGKAIGTVAIYHIDWRSRKCEWGRLFLDVSARGKGYAKNIEALVYNYVFEHLNMNKLYCEVFAFNEGVIKAHQNFGHQIEGTLRNHVYRFGKYQNVVTMSILQADYLICKEAGIYAEYI